MSAPLDTLRAAFPYLDSAERPLFLDWAATGLLPEPARIALSRFAEDVARCAGGSSTWFHGTYGAVRGTARARLAQLLGRNAEEVALVESTTAALIAIIDSVPVPQGANVVLSANDYLAVVMPWRHRAEREGIELRWVEGRGGVTRAEDLLEVVDERTVSVTVSSIGWTTGARMDLDALGQGLMGSQAMLIVDAVQSFGVLPSCLGGGRVDAMAVGGHKWLSSPLGAGFLWVNPEAFARCGVPASGFLAGRSQRAAWWLWFQDPESRLDEPVEFPALGRSFEMGGTPSYPGAIGLAESAKLLLDAGCDRVGRHATGLAAQLGTGLRERGLQVLTPEDSEEHGAMVVFRLQEGPEAEGALVAALEARGIMVSRRYIRGVGGIRVSCHGMNREHETARFLEELDRALGER